VYKMEDFPVIGEYEDEIEEDEYEEYEDELED
jgi:hypothetical protein